MKRLVSTLLVLALVILSSVAFASGEAYTISEKSNVYTFTGLNPLYETGSHPGILNPTQVYLNLYHRGVPVLNSTIQKINQRFFMVLTLEDGRQFAFDALECFGDDNYFIAEETLYQFLKFYFGEDYDYFDNEPEFSLWI